MSKNKLIRPFCKNSGKNRGNKTQKILKRVFSMSKISYFSPYTLKTKQGIHLKFCLYVPEVEAIKSCAGIFIFLLFYVFMSKKLSKMAIFHIF